MGSWTSAGFGGMRGIDSGFYRGSCSETPLVFVGTRFFEEILLVIRTAVDWRKGYKGMIKVLLLKRRRARETKSKESA